MPKRRSFTLEDTHTFVASQRTEVRLPRSGFITHLQFDMEVTHDTGLAPTALEDALSRLIKAMRIRGPGGESFLEITDGRQLHWMNMFDYWGNVKMEQPSTVASQTGLKIKGQFIFHPGLEQFRRFDRTSVIPAAEVGGDIIHSVTWGTNADLGAQQTITAAKMKVSVNELDLEAGEKRESLFPSGIPQVIMEPRAKTNIAIAANLGLDDEVPTGRTLTKSLVMVLDAAGNRSDTQVSEIGIAFPKDARTPFQRDWHDWLQLQRVLGRFGPATPVGVSELLWRDVDESGAIGLDTVDRQVGDVLLSFTVDVAGGSIQLLHVGFKRGI